MEETMCQQLEDRIANLNQQIEFEAKEILYNQKCFDRLKKTRRDLVKRLDALILAEICVDNKL